MVLWRTKDAKSRRTFLDDSLIFSPFMGRQCADFSGAGDAGRLGLTAPGDLMAGVQAVTAVLRAVVMGWLAISPGFVHWHRHTRTRVPHW